MFQKRVFIDKNEAEFSFQLDSLPAKAAIDPRMIYIDRVYKDNIKSVSLKDWFIIKKFNLLIDVMFFKTTLSGTFAKCYQYQV